MTNEDAYQMRLKRVNDAIELKQPDRVPIVPMIESLPYFISENTTYKDSMYNYSKATTAIIDFYKDFEPDAVTLSGMTSGKANEVAGSSMIDWPGRPGTKISETSTCQVIENEYMLQNEYRELLTDYTGFMLRKYIPRAFPKLSGLSDINIVPTVILNTTALSNLYMPSVFEAMDKLKKIGEFDGEAAVASQNLQDELTLLGFPSFVTGVGEAPYDILSDYFRGTLGVFDDLIECPDMIEKACDLFTDIEIASFDYFKNVSMPVKRVVFPLHKGMDGFMSPSQYEKLYWKPLLKIVNALVDMGVTPFLYGEGPYDSRIEQMVGLPKGKVIVHFERADMVKAKNILGDTVCLSGNMPAYLLQFGTKQAVVDATKKVLDICAPGGGYIFDTDASIAVGKRENVEAMFDTVRQYGKY